jgi:uncharacterized protein (DUF1501 family)
MTDERDAARSSVEGITRRQFLGRGTAIAAGLTLAPYARWIPGTNVSYAAGPAGAIVVFVQLNGGNDGLGTVYPLTGNQRDLYEEYRPTLKLPATASGLAPWQDLGIGGTAILDIGENGGTRYALHPAMTGFHGLFEAGRLAICHGVHYPHPNHSHFRSEEIYYTLDPLGTSGRGWFGRFLTQAGFAPTDVPGVMIGSQQHPLFTPTDTSLFAFRRLSELVFPAAGERNLKRDVLRTIYQAAGTTGALFPERAKIGVTGVATIDKMEAYYVPGDGFGNAGKVEALLLDPEGDYDRDNPLVYPSPLNSADNSAVAGLRLARDLRHVAATIRADVGARFFHVDIGGFDTHSSQEKGLFHSALLYEVSAAVSAFFDEIGRAVSLPAGYSGYRTGDLAGEVLIVTVSEFGRTMRQNAQGANSAGTDHAASAPQFVIGGAVTGGQYGIHAALDDPPTARENDLRMVFDFRDFYGTILHRWLGVSLSDLGPGTGKLLPATPDPDGDGNSYTAFTPLGFLDP